MALKCSFCRSASVSVGVGDEVSCFDCGEHGPHLHVGEPSPAGESPEPDEGLAVDDAAGEVTVEATPAEDSEEDGE